MRPRVLILRSPGTNADEETAHAFALAGGAVERVHVNRLLERPDLADAYQILCVPGGFSYGDDLAAGRVLGNQIRDHLADALHRFHSAGKLILGICNGFQVLLKSGLLLADDAAGPTATLTWNDSGHYEDRWVHLVVASPKCVFLRGIERMYVPVAHAEGKFVPRDNDVLSALDRNGQLVLRFSPDGAPRDPATSTRSVVSFPANPNGAIADVAGVCDPTGRVLGLMPHPERHVDPTHHPRWTRGEAGPVGDGLRLFQNAVEYFR